MLLSQGAPPFSEGLAEKWDPYILGSSGDALSLNGMRLQRLWGCSMLGEGLEEQPSFLSRLCQSGACDEAASGAFCLASGEPANPRPGWLWHVLRMLAGFPQYIRGHCLGPHLCVAPLL